MKPCPFCTPSPMNCGGVCLVCGKPRPSATAPVDFVLPSVAGRRLRGSNDDFERSCLVHIERLQHGFGDFDSAMLDTFCEAVRLVREYSDAMNIPNTKLRDGQP